MNLTRRYLFGMCKALPLFMFAIALLPVQAQEARLKVGFIYSGPVNDRGFTQANEKGRLEAQKELPWLDSSYVESVTENDLDSYIDDMADNGVKVIFITSTGFTDGTIECAARHPDIIFFIGGGYKRAPNVGTFAVDTYQCCYLEGLAAGAISKAGVIGSVSTYPTPDVVRPLDAFTIGLREVNPKAIVKLRWLNSYYDPPAAKEAAEALISEGADYLISDMDSGTVASVGEEHHIPSNVPSEDTFKEAPNSLVASAVSNLETVYVSILKKVHDGTYTTTNLQNTNIWLRMAENSAQLLYDHDQIINPRYKEVLSAVKVGDGKGGNVSVYDLISQRIVEMSATPVQFEPFTGPMSDAAGKLEISAGQMATQAQLMSLSWRLPEIRGNWPTR